MRPGSADLRIVATVGAYRLWESTIDSAADMVTIAAFMRAAGLSWTVRGSIENNTANNDYGAFVGLGRGIENAAVAAIWEDAELVRDPYSDAASSTVALTLHTSWGFKIPRTANYKRLKFVS